MSGYGRQAEVLKTVVGKIVCHFRRVNKRAILESIEVKPAEGAGVQPLTLGSLLTEFGIAPLRKNPLGKTWPLLTALRVVRHRLRS